MVVKYLAGLMPFKNYIITHGPVSVLCPSQSKGLSIYFSPMLSYQILILSRRQGSLDMVDSSFSDIGILDHLYTQQPKTLGLERSLTGLFSFSIGLPKYCGKYKPRLFFLSKREPSDLSRVSDRLAILASIQGPLKQLNKD
jgi:hypothetical protein